MEGGVAGHPPALPAACGAHCGYARAEVLRRSTWLDIKGNWIITKWKWGEKTTKQALNPLPNIDAGGKG